MPKHRLSVREIRKEDIDFLLRYWLESTAEHHAGMGVDLSKMPEKEKLRKILLQPINLPYGEKPSYCILWESDGNPVGHSNINQIVFGEEASIHLHLWNAPVRKNGMGTEFVKMTLPYFFTNMRLKKIYCEPYALNPAPNNTLPKLGFEFVKEYVTTPGWLNFEQPVRRWELSLEKFMKLYPHD